MFLLFSEEKGDGFKSISIPFYSESGLLNPPLGFEPIESSSSREGDNFGDSDKDNGRVLVEGEEVGEELRLK